MASNNVPLGRRMVLGAGGVLAAGLTRAAFAQGGPQARVAPITIVINQSPWLDSFRRSVEQYERETGAKVDLDVQPFAGSL